MTYLYISPHYRISVDSDFQAGILHDIKQKTKVLDENGIETNVSILDIYRDQVNGWYFDIADTLTSNGASGFVILMIVAGFFEKHGQLTLGQQSVNNSGNIFKQSFIEFLKRQNLLSKEKFDTEQGIKAFVDRFYAGIRSGLFHDMMIRYGIQINWEISKPIVVIDNNEGKRLILISPPLLLRSTRDYFDSFFENISQNQPLQDKVLVGWNSMIKNSLERGGDAASPSNLAYSDAHGTSIPYSGGTVSFPFSSYNDGTS